MTSGNIEKRIAKLSGRTSSEAWTQLKRMRHHPRFEELLKHLEGTDGSVSLADVEDPARRFLDEETSN
jgi:hypothetical protein